MIVVAGEALVDLAPRDGSLLPLPGGSPYNVCLGLGRLEVPTSFLGPLSTDGFGERLAARLAADRVDLALAPRTDEPTTLAVVHLDEQARAGYGFYLAGTSAAGLRTDDLPDLDEATALHVSLGAVTFETEPAGAALLALLSRERGRRTRCLDPNIRPAVIEDLPAYARQLGEVVARTDLVKVSDEDLALLHPDTDPVASARRWASSGPALVVCTRGPDGATAWTADGREISVDGEPVDVVDTVGAGDAFTSGLLAWLHAHDRLALPRLQGVASDDVEAALRAAVHVAAVTCTRAGSDPPRRGEL